MYDVNLSNNVPPVRNLIKGDKGLQQQRKELPPVHSPMERLGIDLVDMVASAQGYRYVLTVVDHYKRYVRFSPFKTKHTTHIIEYISQYMADYWTP